MIEILKQNCNFSSTSLNSFSKSYFLKPELTRMIELLQQNYDFLSKISNSIRLARSRKSGPGGQEVVNDQFDKELNREMDGFR